MQVPVGKFAFWFEHPDLALYLKEPVAFSADIDLGTRASTPRVSKLRVKCCIYKATRLINVLYLNSHFSKCTLLPSADAE